MPTGQTVEAGQVMREIPLAPLVGIFACIAALVGMMVTELVGPKPGTRQHDTLTEWHGPDAPVYWQETWLR